VPIYGTHIGFANCSDEIDVAKVSEKEIAKRIKERGVKDLKLYGPEMHHGFLAATANVLKKIKDPHVKIITKGTAIHVYDELNDEDAFTQLKKMMG
jgi:hypothetical protein